MADLNPLPKFALSDSNGDPAVGYKIYTYEPGTVVDKATYTTAAEGTANTNPVILDARGEADIWWSGLYKVVIHDADDNLVYSIDNYGSAITFDLSNNATFAGNVTLADGKELILNRTTDDDGFINFQATADADATSAISTLTTSGATTHHIQILVNGVPAWIAVSTTDPT